MLVAVIVVAAAVAVLGAVVASVILPTARRGRTATPPGPARVPDANRPDVAPMTGLESVLDSVTDRAGRNMRQNLEAEAAIVEDLRVAGDTGPIPRRALDRVGHPAPPSADGPNAP